MSRNEPLTESLISLRPRNDQGHENLKGMHCSRGQLGTRYVSVVVSLSVVLVSVEVLEARSLWLCTQCGGVQMWWLCAHVCVSINVCVMCSVNDYLFWLGLSQ